MVIFTTMLDDLVQNALNSGNLDKLETALDEVEHVRNLTFQCTGEADDGDWETVADNLKFAIDALTRS